MRRVRVMATIGAIVGSVAVLSGVALAAAPAWQTPRPATFGDGVRFATPDDRMTGISCTAPGDCTAVGYFNSSAGAAMAFTQTSVDGVWSQARPVVFPDGLLSDPAFSELYAVSCASDGDCTAVGRYRRAEGGWAAFTVSSTDGVWAAVETVTFADGVQYAQPDDVLYAVSCASAGNCTAVGNFNNVDRYVEAFSVTSTSGNWDDGVPATFASGVAGDPLNTFYSVSCVSAGNCTAVGSFRDTIGSYTFEAFAQTSTGGAWAEAVPSNHVSPSLPGYPDGVLRSVSCMSPGNCVAVGRFLASDYDQLGFSQVQTSGAWGPATPVAFAAGVQSLSPVNDVANSVSCVASGECIAVGLVDLLSGGKRAYWQRYSGGAWEEAVLVPFSGDMASGASASWLSSVSCTSAGNCAAVGSFVNGGGSQQGFVMHSIDGVWSSPTASDFGAGVESTSSKTGFAEVSCAAAGECGAAGTFKNASDYPEGFTQMLTTPSDPPVLPPTGASPTLLPALVLVVGGSALVMLSARSRRPRHSLG